MKTIELKLIVVGLLSTMDVQLSTCLAQGNLNPPGAPAPTMLSLSQMEPRTPISSAPFTISAPGSYYLTTNVTVSGGNAITINANNVTLDLKGFTISSTQNPAGTNSGILLGTTGPLTNITIVNGFINSGVTINSGNTYSGTGFGYGIFYYYLGTPPVNVRVSGVSVSGCLYSGIDLNTYNAVVESCTVNMAGSYGIVATSVSDSTVVNCGNAGVWTTTANNCYGSCLDGDGVDADTANDCYGYGGNGGAGVFTSTANNCYGYAQFTYGVYASGAATSCYGYGGGGGTGIYAVGAANNCSGTSVGSGIGVEATTANNCYGNNSSDGTGVEAGTANNCYGYNTGTGVGITIVGVNNGGGIAVGCYGYSSGPSPGIYASQGIAIGCYGYSASGYGITAQIGNSCIVGGGTTNIVYKYNMP